MNTLDERIADCTRLLLDTRTPDRVAMLAFELAGLTHAAGRIQALESFPNQRCRDAYELGLEDGQTLLRLAGAVPA